MINSSGLVSLQSLLNPALNIVGFGVKSKRKKQSEEDLLAKITVIWNKHSCVISCPLPRLQRFLLLFLFWPISMCNHYHQVTLGVCLLRSTWHAGAVYPSRRGKHARPNAVAVPAWNQRNHRALPQLAAKKNKTKKLVRWSARTL